SEWRVANGKEARISFSIRYSLLPIRPFSRPADPYPAVLFALFLDLGHAHGADFGGAPDMSAAARLQVDAGDLDEPHAAAAHRRLDRHGLHQTGVGFKFRVGDPARGYRRISGDHGGELGGDLVLVEAGLGNIEVEAAVVLAPRAPRAPVRDYRRKQTASPAASPAP